MSEHDEAPQKSKLFARHKYLDDYEIVNVDEPGGRARRRVVYRSAWTVLREPEAARSRLWGIAALAVLAVAADVWMLLLVHTVSGSVPVMAGPLFGLFAGIYLLVGAASLPYRRRPMRRDQYRFGIVRARRSAMCMAVFTALGPAASLVYRIVTGNWGFQPNDWLFILLCAAIVCAALAIVRLIRSIQVEERENDAFKSELM